MSTNLYYWAGNKGKGHEIALVFEDGRVMDVDLTNGTTIQPAARVYRSEGHIGEVHKSLAGWGVTAYVGDRTAYGRAGDREEAIRKVSELAGEIRTEVEREKDPTYALEKLLRYRDWYAHMSDDHSVWSAAMAEDRILKELLKKVDGEKARELWAKYAPDSIGFPS